MLAFVLILLYPLVAMAVMGIFITIFGWIADYRRSKIFFARQVVFLHIGLLVGLLIITMNQSTASFIVSPAVFSVPTLFKLPHVISSFFAIAIAVTVGAGFFRLEAFLFKYRGFVSGEITAGTKSQKIDGVYWDFSEIGNFQKGVVLIMLTATVALEEYLWRAYVLEFAFNDLLLSIPLSMVISSTSFGIAHWYSGLFNVISKTLMGYLLCSSYFLFDSLFPPIVIHLVYNLMVFGVRLRR